MGKITGSVIISFEARCGTRTGVGLCGLTRCINNTLKAVEMGSEVQVRGCEVQLVVADNAISSKPTMYLFGLFEVPPDIQADTITGVMHVNHLERNA